MYAIRKPSWPTALGFFAGCLLLLALDAVVTCSTGCALFDPHAPPAAKAKAADDAKKLGEAGAIAAATLIPQPLGMLLAAAISGAVGGIGGHVRATRKATRLAHSANSVPPLPPLKRS